jgi:hypothetical protein
MLVVVTVKDMRNNRVAHNVFFMEFHHTYFGKLAQAVNGIDKPILATEHFKVRLFGVADKADFGIFTYTRQASFDV